MPPIATEKPEIRRVEIPPPPSRKIEIAAAAPPPPLAATDFARSEPKVEPRSPPPVAEPPAEPVKEATKEPTSEPNPPPKATPAKPGPTWPPSRLDQVKAIQAGLRDLRFYRGTPDGKLGASTRNAIRDYERMAGLKETGEPSRAVFDSLKEMRNLMKR